MFLWQVPQRTWPDTAVHDTVRAVVRDPAFRRSLRTSLFDTILLWMYELVARVARLLSHAPSGRTLALWLVAFIVIVVAARLVIAATASDSRARGSGPRRGAGSVDEPWQRAEELIAAGRFEDAAHALYRGVITSLAHAERIRLDPSKTSGDYARELRRRGASSLAPFRAFIRRFDLAVYGHGGCDADAVNVLRELSGPFRQRARAA